MVKHTGLAAAIALGVLAGCGQGPVPVSQAPSGRLIADPCAIALITRESDGAVAQAIHRYQRSAQRPGVDTAYLERLGWAYVAKARSSLDPGYYTLAEQTAICMEARRPGAAEAQLLRGHVLHQQHRFHAAEVLARRLVETRGLWFDHGLLGDVLMEQGRLKEAAAAYQAMMDQRPGPEAYARAAHLRWLTGDLEGAIDLMRRAVRATGTRPPGASAWARTRLARLLRQAGLAHEAMAHLRAALALVPDYPPARLEQGLRHLAQGLAEEAIAPLRRAADSNPLPETLWALVEALQAAGRNSEALAVERQMRSGGERDDPRTYALYLAGRGLEPDTALRLARAELAVRADVFTLDALAWALHAAGQDRAAQAYSSRALAEGTPDARLFYHAGVIAAAGGDHARARERLDRARALQHMLLPSERAGLAKTLAAVAPQTPRLAAR